MPVELELVATDDLLAELAKRCDTTKPITRADIERFQSYLGKPRLDWACGKCCPKFSQTFSRKDKLVLVSGPMPDATRRCTPWRNATSYYKVQLNRGEDSAIQQVKEGRERAVNNIAWLIEKDLPDDLDFVPTALRGSVLRESVQIVPSDPKTECVVFIELAWAIVFRDLA